MVKTANTRGRPKGSKNANPIKPWSEAIRRALLRGDNLNDLAEALIQKAIEGDIQAMKEIGDRTEGKALQTVAATVDASLTVNIVRFGRNQPT